MGEHQSGWQKTLHEKTGQDVYFWNFIFLMVFTAIEVGAVYLSLNYGWTVFALVSVGVVKFFGIAAFFMHLWDDERELTYTFAFPFEFEFFPRDADESKKVLEIIRCFKYYAAPQLGSEEGFAGAFISSPDVFQLTYMSGKGKPHPFLNNFMPMALVETKVNYSGSGTFSTFHDGTPTHIKLTLTFKELNPVYREDYDEGIGKNGVGY